MLCSGVVRAASLVDGVEAIDNGCYAEVMEIAFISCLEAYKACFNRRS